MNFGFMMFIAALLGLIPGYIASKKGYDAGQWWMFGALLFIVAFPCSLFLKDKSGKKCPACAEYIKKEATICKHCRTAV